MEAEARVRRWQECWERRRQRCLDQEDVGEWRTSLPAEARAILEEARALAAVADPGAHAAAPVDRIVDRVNALPPPAPMLLHGPICNGLTMLRCAAQELEAARAGVGVVAPVVPVRQPSARGGLGRSRRFSWFLVVGDSAELVELVNERSAALPGPPPVRVAGSIESALEELRREGAGLVLTTLTLPSVEGWGPHGLRIAAAAHRRRHAVLLVTAAGDYLDYWARLAEAGLTGHHVVIKTRRDFTAQVRRRLRELVEPEPLSISYEADTGHVVRIGDIEISQLEAQEATVLRFLDGAWQTPEVVADACRTETDLAPSPAGVPPLISSLRRKLEAELVAAESGLAQREVIETRRRDGLPVQYRLAPWLRWEDPPEAAGAAHALPPLLLVEDDPDWALWVLGWLEELCWPARAVATPDAVWEELERAELPVLIADLALRRSVGDLPDPQVGIDLIEEVAARRHGVRVVVLSAHGGRDTLLARLFEAGVRTVDVIDKAAGRDECRAVLLASLQRAADEVWRGIRRGRELAPAHRVVRRERHLIEVDGRAVPPLSPREADVLDVLFRRANQPVKAETLELCFPAGTGTRSGSRRNPLNKVQLIVHRLRQKIDRGVGSIGVGESVIRTRHRGAVSTYQLFGLPLDLVGQPEPPPDQAVEAG